MNFESPTPTDTYTEREDYWEATRLTPEDPHSTAPYKSRPHPDWALPMPDSLCWLERPLPWCATTLQEVQNMVRKYRAEYGAIITPSHIEPLVPEVVHAVKTAAGWVKVQP